MIESQSIKYYLTKELEDCEPMAYEEMVETARRAKAGDEAAFQELISRNARFVVFIAKKFNRGDGVSMDDLVSAGNVGLVQAVKHFDPEKGFKFTPFAKKCIENRIGQEFAMMSQAISLPIGNTMRNFKAVTKAAERLKQAGNPYPTAEDLADESGLSPACVAAAMVMMGRDVSMDTRGLDPRGKAYKTSWKERLEDDAGGPERNAEKATAADLVEGVLANIPPRAQDIFRRRYGIGRGGVEQTYEEIGEAHGLSRERVRQILNLYFGKFRKYPSNYGIPRSEMAVEGVV